MSRVLHALALGAALALCGPLLPAAIGSNSVTAQAADFTGQVRRIRIKARNNGAGYRLKVVHPAGEIDSAQAVVRDPITGESLASTDLGPAGRATAVAIAKVDPSTLGDRLTIGVTDRDQGFSTVGVALSEGRGEAANADGWKVRAVVNARRPGRRRGESARRPRSDRRGSGRPRAR